ncbi:MAG: UDP-N-acetylmuramate--L-alanine ligase [Elusimicrobia bacterium]|nr:UDP-N-acetylmuramate--L-alanine ligase [Elusimicrobiota bacterium]
MSGIAEVLLNLGYKVSGSDVKLTELTARLQRAGAVVREGHKASHVAGASVVVVSTAVRPDNPEVREAQRRKVPVIHRAAMLAELAGLKKTVTISGSHGKTTTTSMVAMALRAAGADPTIIVGGQLKNLGANATLGEGPYLVAEADESDGSFLFLRPRVAVATNVDNDHLDHYKTMRRLKDAFVRHLNSVPEDGAAVVCVDDPNLASLRPQLERTVITYGLGRAADWRARNVRMSAEGSKFEVWRRGRKIARASLRVAGRHNVLNALGAIAAADAMGFPPARVLTGLAAFRGVGRRMELLGEASGVTFLDDYGHHPTEIRATLDAVASLHCASGKRRLIALFQPHRFSRTKLLRKEFGPAFKRADAVYVTEVYAAGEKPIAGVSSELILRSLRRAGVEGRPFTRAVDMIRDLRPGDLVLTIGAGDVWKIGEDLRRRLKENAIGGY